CALPLAAQTDQADRWTSAGGLKPVPDPAQHPPAHAPPLPPLDPFANMPLRVVVKNTFLDSVHIEGTTAAPECVPQASSCPPRTASRTAPAGLPLTKLHAPAGPDPEEEDRLSSCSLSDRGPGLVGAVGHALAPQAPGSPRAPLGKVGGRVDAPGSLVADVPPHAPTKSDTRTTVMLRNLPRSYTRKELVGKLNKMGFAGGLRISSTCQWTSRASRASATAS
ncbi:unnamed protein product, partial [Prorocentrum cordatum]